MTKAEQAADMRNAGLSVEIIALRFGWSKKTAKELISRGRNYEQFKKKQASYRRPAQGAS